MTYTIGKDGWVSGTLTGPGGVQFPIEKHECPRPGGEAYRRIEKTPPDLLLHTTEGTDLDSAIATLKAKFSPPQFACGENRIAQLRPLWAQGAAVDTMNAYYMQVENVEQSRTTLYLFKSETLNPLVALVAMLHRERIITTGIARPQPLDGLPLVLDKLPAAVASYYRRFLAPEPQFDGVRGHIDSKDDEHWDPGSFDYPTFFQMVEGVIGGADDVTGDEIVKGWRYRLNNPDKPLPPNSTDGFEVGWHNRDLTEKAGKPGGGVPAHSHSVTGSAK